MTPDVQVICVSHTSKENTVLRACLSPHHVWAIPNGKVRQNSQDAAQPCCSQCLERLLCTVMVAVYSSLVAAALNPVQAIDNVLLVGP